MEELTLKQMIGVVIATPIIWGLLWVSCAFGRLYEDQARCDNGATEFCYND
ncbi:MAG: hypothetical protein J6S67_11090 [Methanobrevibacter sp.]|nr:hypothetical protein [Methanobrevibacter sp.]